MMQLRVLQQQQRVVGAPSRTAPPAAAPKPARALARRRRAAAAASAVSSSPAVPPRRRRRARPPVLAAAAAAAADGESPAGPADEHNDQPAEQTKNQERKEYYDAREMPPLPLTVARIAVPELGVVVVDASTEQTRPASLAIFTEMWRSDDHYGGRLNRRSAITALCMYDRDDVAAARQQGAGLYPSIDLLEKVYAEGLDVEVVVEEK
jgi:hypothetical protein